MWSMVFVLMFLKSLNTVKQFGFYLYIFCTYYLFKSLHNTVLKSVASKYMSTFLNRWFKVVCMIFVKFISEFV